MFRLLLHVEMRVGWEVIGSMGLEQLLLVSEHQAITRPLVATAGMCCCCKRTRWCHCHTGDSGWSLCLMLWEKGKAASSVSHSLHISVGAPSLLDQFIHKGDACVSIALSSGCAEQV